MSFRDLAPFLMALQMGDLMEVLWREGHRLTFPAVWFQSQHNDPQPSVPNQPQTPGQGPEVAVTQSPVCFGEGPGNLLLPCLGQPSRNLWFGDNHTSNRQTGRTKLTSDRQKRNSLICVKEC